jgi:general L-amino acid transport system permease protein
MVALPTKMPAPPPPKGLRDYLSDTRVIAVVVQVFFMIVLVSGLSLIWINILNNLAANGLTPTFDFLLRRAGFSLSESPVWYTPDSTYGEAFLVGVINTIRVVSVGLVLTTVLGVFVGIFLLSSNWLIRNISLAYVEILRNTPLLVQLIFIYFVVMLGLPAQDITVPNEGILIMPWRYPLYVVVVIIALVWAVRSARPGHVRAGALLAIALTEIAFWLTQPGTNSPDILLSDSSVLSLLTIMAIGGAVLFVATWFTPKDWLPFILAVAMVPAVLLLGHVLFQLAFYLGLVADPEAFITTVYPVVFMGAKGMAFPEIRPTAQFPVWMAFIGAGLALAVAMWNYSGHVTETTGRPIARTTYAIVTVLVAAVAGWFIIGLAPATENVPVPTEDGTVQLMPRQEALDSNLLSLEETQLVVTEPAMLVLPSKPRFRFESGTVVSLEFMALLLGLVIYTSAFVAEIVRAGIQAVPYGQLEAARAVGLSQGQTLSLVILPQALRVIIPPMGNQYLNLAKNSSLATAIGFMDTYAVGQIVMNQSGQSVTGFTLVLLVYLSMSLIISVFMNIMNSRFQLVTR